MSQIFASVVIPAYNEQDTIGFCLESLVAQKTEQDFEVIVVDNNSTDRTAEVVMQYESKLNLRLLSEKKKGRGAARGAGFEAARSDIIFSTDADSMLPENWIELFTSFFSDKNIVAVTGTGKIIDNTWYKNAFFNVFQPMSMRSYRLFMRHYWLSGFSFAIRKDIYEKAGKIDTTLNALDDIDLGLRVVKHGKIKFVPNAPAIMSGRRFRDDFIKGLISYYKPFMQVVRQESHKVYMDDLR